MSAHNIFSETGLQSVIIAEVKAMYEAGWPPREIRRVTGLNQHTLHNLLYNIPDGMSAARAKGRWDAPRRRK